MSCHFRDLTVAAELKPWTDWFADRFTPYFRDLTVAAELKPGPSGPGRRKAPHFRDLTVAAELKPLLAHFVDSGQFAISATSQSRPN